MRTAPSLITILSLLLGAPTWASVPLGSSGGASNGASSLGKFRLDTDREIQNSICENCGPSYTKANSQDSIVIRMSKFDTYFMDVIDNATTHTEHHVKFKLNF